MTTFWKVRILTAFWGFGVTYLFTGHLWQSTVLMAVVILGNTVIMRWLIK